MATAKNGDTIRLHYTGTLDDGTVFDCSGGSGPIVYSPVEFVLGQGDLPPRCQEAIVGLEPGQSLKVRVACRDAYGPRDETLIFEVPRDEINQREETLDGWTYANGKKLPGFELKRGDQMVVALNDGGHLPVLVTEVGDATVICDANHPLAGHDLNFDIKLVQIL
jgi:peptidylprolyl isomerase